MADNCCTFSSKFCTTSGQVVIGRMKLQNGSFSISYFNIDGTPNTSQIFFPNCITQYTSLLNTTFRFSPSAVCTNGDAQLSTETLLSDTASIKNGSIIRFTISIVKYGSSINVPFTLESDMAVGVLEKISDDSFRILDKNAIISNLNKVGVKVLFKRENCNENLTLNGVVFSVVNMNSGWGNGVHTPITFNLLN